MKKILFLLIVFLQIFNAKAEDRIMKSLPLTLDLKAFNQDALYQGQKQFYFVSRGMDIYGQGKIIVFLGIA